MRTRIDFIAGRVKEFTEGIGCDVVLAWRAPGSGVLGSGVAIPLDPVDGAPTVPMIDRSETVRALLYFVGATTQIRQFAEIQAGDCIATFDPDLDLKGKDSLRFQINGEEWSSKPVSEQLSSYWGMAANLKLYQVVLLRRGT